MKVHHSSHHDHRREPCGSLALGRRRSRNLLVWMFGLAIVSIVTCPGVIVAAEAGNEQVGTEETKAALAEERIDAMDSTGKASVASETETSGVSEDPSEASEEEESSKPEALRRQSKINNYVILRATRLVPDDEFPDTAPTGLLYQQGDGFFFWGPAGNPGMSNTQLAQAVRTAMKVQGHYTVELTSGPTNPHDPSYYDGSHLQQDDELQFVVTPEQAMQCHEKALVELKIYLGVMGLVFVRLMLRVQWGLPARIIVLVLLVNVFIVVWTAVMGPKSVLDCAVDDNNAGGGGTTNEL